MKTSGELCAEIELRLVDGRPVAEDPAVAAHLRTCLRCFRTATELREVPQLAALLRQGQEDDQPDPGELFWARFPKTVADAWERRQRQATTTPVSVLGRVGTLLKRPIPAALAGAAVAAALVLLLVPRGHSPSPAAPLAAVAVAPATDPDKTSLEDDTTANLLGEDDPLEVLDLADARVVARLTASTEPDTTDEGADLAPSPAEELELLETDDLRAVAQALRGRGQI